MSDHEAKEARSGSRDSMLLVTELRDLNGTEMGRAVIRNISGNGMLVEGDFALKLEQIVRFDLRNIGELSGEVTRIEPGQIGIRFHREIDPQMARRPIGSTRR